MGKRNLLEGERLSIFDRLEQSKAAKARLQHRARFGEEPLPVHMHEQIMDVMLRPGPIVIMKNNFQESLAGRVLTVMSRFSI